MIAYNIGNINFEDINMNIIPAEELVKLSEKEDEIIDKYLELQKLIKEHNIKDEAKTELNAVFKELMKIFQDKATTFELTYTAEGIILFIVKFCNDRNEEFILTADYYCDEEPYELVAGIDKGQEEIGSWSGPYDFVLQEIKETVSVLDIVGKDSNLLLIAKVIVIFIALAFAFWAKNKNNNEVSGETASET